MVRDPRQLQSQKLQKPTQTTTAVIGRGMEDKETETDPLVESKDN